MDIYVIKLTSGEDIIAVVKDRRLGEYEIENPLGVVLFPDERNEPQVRFTTWPMFSDQMKKTMVLENHTMLYSYPAPEDLQNGYREAMSAFWTPPKQILLG